MRHNRLSPRWINRFIVLVLLLLPLVYLAVCSFSVLMNEGIVLNDYERKDFFYDIFGIDNFLTLIGINALSDSQGFSPWNEFLFWLDSNIFFFGPDYADWYGGYFIYGYMSWVFYVLIADLAVYMSTFIVRIPFMITKWFERRSGND